MFFFPIIIYIFNFIYFISIIDESSLKLIDTIGWDTNFKTSKAPIFLYAG